MTRIADVTLQSVARDSRDAVAPELTLHTGQDRTGHYEQPLPGAFLDSLEIVCASWKLRGAS